MEDWKASIPAAVSIVKMELLPRISRSITDSVDQITSNLCSDSAGQKHSFPFPQSYRWLFVRAEKLLLSPKIHECAESVKPVSSLVLGFRWLAVTADIVHARENIHELS